MTGERLPATINEAKLYPATGTGRQLARPRLDASRDVLDAQYPVVVVVAPAGYHHRGYYGPRVAVVAPAPVVVVRP